MASRPRTIKNRKLPPNLYPNGKYWRYRNPITGLMTSINRPLEDAIKLARAANAKLAPVMAGDGELLMILTGDRLPTMRNLVERFEAEWLKDRGYAARTLVEIQFKLERYRQDLGDQLVGQLDVLTVAEYLASPYLIHYRPKARKREQIAAKDHWTSVTPNYLSNEFSKARDAAHAYDHIPATERPTFHEIRALGAWLYEQQNFPQEYIQALMGHADAKMTKHYQDGHTEKGIEYLEVGADLAF